MGKILEDKRSQLIANGRNGKPEKTDGKTRYEKRVKSRVSTSTSRYNKINMNELFKNNILTIDVDVRGETDDYTVTMSFGGFLDKLQEQLKRNNDTLDLRIIVRALVESFDREDVYIHCSCLHPTTKIRLLDGTSPTVEEMLNRFNNGEKLYVYSTDINGDFKPGEVENVWITKYTTDFIRVTLDNDEEILTTPDHLYMLRNGEYRQAQFLESGISLMPTHKVVKIEKVTLSETPVYDISVKDYHNFVVDAGVVLHNCPDWKYRMNFWSTVNKINSGAPENRPSKITNPVNDLGPGCKHVMLVLSNHNWLIKVASVINNYIKYFEKHRQREYADIIYPAVYGKKYEEPVQLDVMDSGSDNLDTSTDTIDIANKLGAVSGRFKSDETNPSVKRGLINKWNNVQPTDKKQIGIDTQEESDEQ